MNYCDTLQFQEEQQVPDQGSRYGKWAVSSKQ